MNQDTNSKTISNAVIRRLPRYFRYLRELIRNDITRISSKELSEKMNVTASQIRQDLNCFGGFGQQGYGYNVTNLYGKISTILGTDKGYSAVIVGIGNLGKALANNPLFEKRGVKIIGLFDTSPEVIGNDVAGLKVLDYSEIEKFLSENKADIAVLTVPKNKGKEVAEKLAQCGIRGFWNFSNMELSLDEYNVKIENIHLGDTLMTLCYEISKLDEENEAQK
ncbi:MAG: redox-sensing transcriptional repressor Rex [Ruminococcaceae bacterium]|nr:redox-sensing transcriptional repressor Rex [Oscillospiraceae bacterium]